MPGERKAGIAVTPQAVLGVLIIVVGLLLMAGNLGWVEARQLLCYWPLGIVAVGATMFARATDDAAKLIAGAVLLLGAWLTGARIFGYDADVGDIWPVLLIGAGIAMLTRARRSLQGTPATTDQTITDFAFWSGVERRITSSAFKRGEFTVVMGGIEVDLRQAATAGEAVIDVFVMWGGLEIRVPPDWSVSNQVVAIMGGAVDKSTGTRDAKNRLILRGFVLMGGIEVKV
jgi:predicted membrane protein